MATLAIDVCRNKTGQLAKKIDEVAQLMGLPRSILQLINLSWSISWSYISLAGLLFCMNIARPSIKKQIALDPKCVIQACKLSTEIRDKLFRLKEKTKTAPFFLKPQHFLFTYLLDEWNDLVEDCTIASDPEVAELLAQISDAA